jgi:hypothetical protein
MTKHDELAQEMEQTRAAYAELLSRIPPHALDFPTANPAWGVREVLYHMSIAPRFMIADVKMIARHRWLALVVFFLVPRRLFDWLNKTGTRRGARNATHADLLREYERGHRSAMNALALVSEAQLADSVRYPSWEPYLSGDVTLERLFHYVEHHFESHALDLAAVAEAPRPSPNNERH